MSAVIEQQTKRLDHLISRYHDGFVAPIETIDLLLAERDRLQKRIEELEAVRDAAEKAISDVEMFKDGNDKIWLHAYMAEDVYDSLAQALEQEKTNDIDT